MHVEVVRLRERGVKLSREALAAPVAGCLAMRYWTLKNAHEHREVCEVTLRVGYSPQNPEMIPPLQDARVSKIDANGMVIVGTERVDRVQFPQAWWCRPIPT